MKKKKDSALPDDWVSEQPQPRKELSCPPVTQAAPCSPGLETLFLVVQIVFTVQVVI